MLSAQQKQTFTRRGEWGGKRGWGEKEKESCENGKWNQTGI